MDLILLDLLSNCISLNPLLCYIPIAIQQEG